MGNDKNDIAWDMPISLGCLFLPRLWLTSFFVPSDLRCETTTTSLIVRDIRVLQFRSQIKYETKWIHYALFCDFYSVDLCLE